jgi:hypothetical protein
MSNVISIAAVRSEKLKKALSIHSRKGEAAIIQARSGMILAERITCRDRFAEIINGVGDYLVLDYADIRSIRSATVAQTSIVNASGGFQPAHPFAAGTQIGPILPFEPRCRRTP